MTAFAIAYPAATYRYGPFPSCPGMSRPRSVDHPVIISRGDCPVIIADTPARARALDAALLDCFRAASANGAPGVCHDPASWLTLREALHAAAMAGCGVVRPPAPRDDSPDACAAPGCSAPAMDTGHLCHDCQADMMPGVDPAREAAEARWHFHDAEDTLDQY